MMNKLKSIIADVSYYWKFSGLLVLSMAIIPTLALIYIHQGALAADSIGAFGLLAVLFIITLDWISGTVVFLFVLDWISGKLGASNIKADWRLLWPIFVVGYSVIAIWVLVEMGIPNYRDERSFYAEEAQVEKQIKSGKLDAVRDLGFLYLEKSAPIPYPYSDQSIHKKGENILDKWFTEKLNNGTAKDYTNDMVRFANTPFLQSNVLKRKWLVTASNYGNKPALKQLKALEKEVADIKRKELRQKITQEQKTKESENSQPIKSLGRYLGTLKREASDTITETTAPMTKKWREFQEGVSEGESKSGN